MAPGAFSNWIRENPNKPLRIFWNHAHLYNPAAKPIGITTALKQDRKGLFFEGELHDTAEGLEVQELLKAGRMEASFAFHVTVDEIRKSVRHLTDVAPFEITAANWGMNPLAFIEAVPDTGDQAP